MVPVQHVRPQHSRGDSRKSRTRLGESEHALSAHSSKFILQLAQMDSSVPSDITVDHCISGSGWSNEPPAMRLSGTFRHRAAATSPPYSANTSFELPVSSDLLFLLARGSMSGGTVDIMSSPTVSNVAKVHVTVKYYREDVRDRAKVCLVKRRDGENGVGIFVGFRAFG